MGFNPTTKHLSTGAPTGTTSAGVSPEPYKYAAFQDQKAQGTSGGVGGGASFTKRTLNTTLLDQIGIGLSSSVLTLPAGTYRLYAIAPAYRVSVHVLRFRNTSNSTTVLQGDSAFSGTTEGDVAVAELAGVFTVGATSTFELQNLAANNDDATNLGLARNQNLTAVFATLFLTKLA